MKNQIYLPKENLPKIEEVVYLDNNYQPQSYEDFMKTYEPNEKVEIITEAEWKDRLLHGPQYGPGNEQSKKATTLGTSIGLGILTAVCPPAGIAVAGGIVGGGTVMTITGSVRDDEEMTSLGLDFVGIGASGVIGGVSGSGTHSGKVCRLPICPKK